ncbi:PBSX family phage terminase large subunit [Leuconostoc fallax]|uniref:PBSX family phage terminase large subunit n=1 Tax=Leuconostoc fallax TaxID=1251 RepID=UPI001C1E9778|nr:PBSX family phage terminase large subunit [Leuconostoc fallax]MBU7455690.1 PBSX family phage terminase large subunit [Leuconostoc fallax]
MKPQIDIQKEVQPHFKKVWLSDKPYNILFGGRNSFKSSVVALKLVSMMIKQIIKGHKANVVVIRKVGNTIRDSVYKKIQWALEKFGILDRFSVTVSPFKITHVKTGSTFYFYGSDDFQKLKSNDINDIIAVWYEESAEFKNAEEFDQSNITFMRQKQAYVPHVKFFWSYNPPRNPYEWINEWVEDKKKDPNYLVDYSSYLNDDLGWLKENGNQILDEINRIKENDYDYYRYIYLGEPVGLGTNVYKMDLFQRIEHLEELDDAIVDLYFSADVGHSISATAVSCYGVTYHRKVVLLDTWYYSPEGKVDKMAPDDLSKNIHDFVERMYNKYGKPISNMTMDSAERALRNQYHKDYGVDWHAVAKIKKPDMIDRVQNLLAQGRFYYLPTDNNLKYFIPQHQKYQWEEKSLQTDEPKVIKVDDHCVDNLQYMVLDNEEVLDLAW